MGFKYKNNIRIWRAYVRAAACTFYFVLCVRVYDLKRNTIRDVKNGHSCVRGTKTFNENDICNVAVRIEQRFWKVVCFDVTNLLNMFPLLCSSRQRFTGIVDSRTVQRRNIQLLHFNSPVHQSERIFARLI